jgi:Flp pilus assembly protein TadD
MNLAVVLGLEGHMAEAESIAKANLPVEEANADVAELKRLLARKDTRGAGADRLPVATIARTN